jgi:hypothetical protein
MTTDGPGAGRDPEAKQQRVHSFVAALQDPGARLSIRSFMSFRLKYLGIAEAAAESLAQFESDNQGLIRWYDEAFMRCSTAIVMSAFAMEAGLNEAMMDLKLPPAGVTAIDSARGLLGRAEALAAHQGTTAPSRGTITGQHAALLCKMRDAMAHAKAEWSDEHKTHHALATRIAGQGLPRSPFAAATDPDFPVACMSSGVARWAVASARAYIDGLYTALGLRR